MPGISIGDALLKLGVDPSGLDKGMKEAEHSVKSSVEKIQSSLKVAGAAFTALGAAGLKFVHDAREINAQLGSTAITLGKTTNEMRDLTLATTNVTFPIKSVVATFDLLTRAGMRNTEEIKASAEAFDSLADATGSSAEVVADILVPAFKVFGLELPKTSEEMDKFTWLTKNTTIDLSEFGSVMSYVAMYGADLGLECEDLIAILAALEDRGIGGAEATRLFRTAVKQAADGVAPFNELLGVSQEEIDGFRQQIDAATGLTQEHADVMNEQYGIMDKVKQKWSELTLKAGSFLTPLEPILAGMTALGPVMMFFGTSMGAAAVKTIAHTTALIAHNVASLASAIAIKAVAAAQWLWNAAMTANPIGLIIIAIAALIAAIILIVKNWDTIREKTIEIWNNIVGFLKGICDKIVGFFKDSIDKVKEIWNNVLDWFRDIPEKIGKIFATVKDWILAPFRAAWKGIETGINWLIRMLNKISFTIPSWVPFIGGQTWGLNIPEVSLPTFERGGLITEPTLLYGLKSQRPYAIAGEKGVESVSPVGGTNITNQFNISQLVVREEADVMKIAQELYRISRSRMQYV